MNIEHTVKMQRQGQLAPYKLNIEHTVTMQRQSQYRVDIEYKVKI